jgi:Flp pilus assembly protein TadD
VDELSLQVRLANALVSYVRYIGKALWPQNLAVFYPHPGDALPLWQAVGAGAVLLGISLAVVRTARRQPHFLVGWLWYLGTLVPVIGLVQVGGQAMADRYTYVPLIGLFIMVCWGIPVRLLNSRFSRVVLATAVGILLSFLTGSTWKQLGHWRSTIALFAHALEVTSGNYVAHDSLGNALARRGRTAEALEHYEAALQIKPNAATTHNNLGLALLETGRLERAIVHLYTAIRLQPDSAEAHNNLAVALARREKLSEASKHYAIALRLKPDYKEAHSNLGNILARQGKLRQAVAQFNRALEVDPSDPEVYNNLGVALARQGKLEEAVQHFRTALRFQPVYPEARANLGLALEQLDVRRPISPAPGAPP